MESTYDSLRVNHVWKFGSTGFKREVCAEDGAGSEQDTALAAQQQQSELGAPGAGELPKTLLDRQQLSRAE